MSFVPTLARRLRLPLVGWLLLPAVLSGQQGRLPTLDDLLALEELGAIALSPDGRDVAVVVRRARTAGESYQRDRLGRHTRADVWLASIESGAARNLTRGIDDRSGTWNPIWSPDGRHLALLSTRGAHNVHPWVWDRATQELRRLGERGVETRSNARLSGGWPHQPVAWIDSRTLLLHLLGEGQRPWDFDSWLGATEVASESWPLAAKGTGVTSSVLESGVEGPGRMRGHGEVVLLDVESGRTTALAEGIFWHVLPSPGRERVALVQHHGWDAPDEGALVPFLQRVRTRLAVVDVRGPTPSTAWIEDLPEPALEVDILRYAWSPDGDFLTVPDEEGSVHILDVTTGRHRPLPDGVTSVAWSGGGDLLYRIGGADATWKVTDPGGALAGAPAGSLPASAAGVSGWWGVEDGGAVGAVGGELVEWTPSAPDELRVLGPPPSSAVTGIVWPDPDTERGRLQRDFVLALAEEKDRRYAHLTLSGGSAAVREFVAPTPNSSLRGFDPGVGYAVFRTVERGSYAVHLGPVSSTDSRYREVLRLNPGLATLSLPERKLVRYRSAEGEELLADLVLPYGYEQGRRYPMVVRVYGGSRVAGPRDPADGIASPFLNHHLLATEGYAVLEPSMPLGSDPMLDMVDGVLPAVDRVVELGIADPGKVAVLGQSFGGYSVYSLVTQTDRFAAAIGLAGMTNLTSHYGSIYFSMRYNDWGYQWMEFASSLEYGQIGLGVPPWEDPERYVRNSPVFSADQVNTPLLILHGDLDHVPMAQADELFSALYRLGKRARYVRYWGETHVIQSPENLRDMWGHIIGWLDEHLGGDSVGQEGGAEP